MFQNSKVVVVLASSPDADLTPTEKAWPQNAQIIKDIIFQFGRNCPRVRHFYLTVPNFFYHQ